ncbi:MAG: hypothetical protein ABEJ91_04045, partial [Candidatus Nanohaloarchaea archaeon]
GEFEVKATQIFFGTEDHITLSSTWTNTKVVDGQESPFDENYDASLSFSGSQLTGITLTNNVAAVQNPAADSGNIPALESGESFAGPQDYFQFTYQGLSSENTEDVTVKNDYKVSFQDTLGFSHTLDASKIVAGGDTTLTTTNPFTSGDQVAFYDAGTTGTWESGSDLIAQDIHNGGTVSVSADTTVSTGNDGTLSVTDGAASSDFAEGTYKVVDDNANAAFDAGVDDDIVTDDDSDSAYTAQADNVVAGVTPSAGTVVNATNAQDTDWSIDSFDATGGDSWDSASDALLIDEDADGVYTSSADVVADSDGNSSTTFGGTTSLTAGSGLAAFGAADNVTLIDGGSDGLTSGGGDDLLFQENDSDQNLSTGTVRVIINESVTATSGGVELNSSDPISYNEGEVTANSAYDLGEDIFVEENTAGTRTYSTSNDTWVAGTTPSAGTSFNSTNAFDADWSLDSIDATAGNAWNAGADSIIIDVGDRGTYSAGADTVYNDGGTANRTDGATLLTLGTSARFYDAGSAGFNATDDDEVFLDDDNDGVYTAQADTHIAGITLSSAGASTSLTTTNPWSGASNHVAFQDRNSDSTWQSGNDLIAQDDGDNTYEYGPDSVIAGTAPAGIVQNGDSSKTVYTDVSGRPLTVKWDNTADEATISYQTFSKTVSVGDASSTTDTGYGFSLTTSFQGTSGSETLSISSTDAVLNTRFGSQVRYQSSGVDSTNPDVQVDENGDGFNFGDSDGVDVAVSYDGSGDADQVTTNDGVVDITSQNSETLTNFGSEVSTGSGMDTVSLELPENQRFVQHAFGEVSESSEGVQTPTGFPDSARLDSEGTPSKPSILVGGPLVNNLTARLAEQGKTWKSSKYEANQDVGLVHLVKNGFNGKSALVVAGWDAEDTSAAARFISNYAEHKSALEGKKKVKVDTQTGQVVQ